MTEEVIKDPAEMKIAADASWLCNLFQSYSLEAPEKQIIIRKLINEFKIQRYKKHG